MSFNGLDVVNQIEARVKLAEKAKASSLKNVKAAGDTLEAIHVVFEGVKPLLSTVKVKNPNSMKDKLIHQTSKNVQQGYECAKQTVDNALREYEKASKDLEEAQAALLDVKSKVSICDLTTPVKECTERKTVLEDEDGNISKTDNKISIMDVYSFIVEGSPVPSVNGLYKREERKNGAPVFRNKQGFALSKAGHEDPNDLSWIISFSSCRMKVEWCCNRPDGSKADPIHDEWAFNPRLKLIVNNIM